MKRVKGSYGYNSQTKITCYIYMENKKIKLTENSYFDEMDTN